MLLHRDGLIMLWRFLVLKIFHRMLLLLHLFQRIGELGQGRAFLPICCVAHKLIQGRRLWLSDIIRLSCDRFVSIS